MFISPVSKLKAMQKLVYSVKDFILRIDKSNICFKSILSIVFKVKKYVIIVLLCYSFPNVLYVTLLSAINIKQSSCTACHMQLKERKVLTTLLSINSFLLQN